MQHLRTRVRIADFNETNIKNLRAHVEWVLDDHRKPEQEQKFSKGSARIAEASLDLFEQLEVTTDEKENEHLVTLIYAMQHYLFNKAVTAPFKSQLDKDCYGVLESWTRSQLWRDFRVYLALIHDLLPSHDPVKYSSTIKKSAAQFAKGLEAERSKVDTKRSKWEIYNDLWKADQQLEVNKDKVPFHIALRQAAERAKLDFELAYEVCVEYGGRNNMVYYGVE